ncbi:MAG: sulfite exporter TauE/SafE family protein [Anaerolineae bacterium]
MLPWNSTWQVALGAAAVFLAGLTYGLTGFGFALVATPILVMLLSPRVAVPAVLLMSMANGLFLLIASWRDIQPRRILPLALAGILATPAGAYFLARGPAATLKWFIGAVIILFALAFLLGFQRPVREEGPASIPIGLLSGFLGGSTGMSGPPVILFFTNQGVEQRAFRANLVTYFMVLNLITLPLYAFHGLVTREVGMYALAALPALALGTWAGVRLTGRVNPRLFRRITLLLVLMAGISSILSGFGIF